MGLTAMTVTAYDITEFMKEAPDKIQAFLMQFHKQNVVILMSQIHLSILKICLPIQ